MSKVIFLTACITDIVYQNMLSDTKAAPWSRNISVLDVGIYSQKRDDFYRRLSQEKDAFRAAIKEINTARDERLKHEKQKSLTNFTDLYNVHNLNFIKTKKLTPIKVSTFYHFLY